MSQAKAVLAEQFDDLEQQRQTTTMGMWVFLATEVLFFGGLFMAYIVYRYLYPHAFLEGSRHLNIWLATINTAVLLCSSLTMALAVHAVRVDNRKLLVIFLLATMLLGMVFLGIKAIEYYQEYQEHLIPGLNFSVESADARQVEIFFLLYFFMTGLHAIHLTIGIFILALMAFWSWRSHFSAERYMPIEISGLYWHFIDIVWVFLFPMLYLVDLHK